MTPALSIDGLRLLVAVGSHRSLRAVAEHLQLSQPTVSANLTRLERQLGCQLADRSPRGSSLTATGRAIVAAGARLLEEAELFDNTLPGLLATEQERPVRVSASFTIAEYLMPSWLARARSSAHTHLELDLDVGNSEHVMTRVLRGRSDIGFVEGAAVREGLHSMAIGADRLVAVARAGHPATEQRQTLESVLALPLAVREPGSGTREVFIRAVAARELALPASVLSLGSTSAIKNAVRQSEMVGVVSELAVRDELARGELAELVLDDLDLTRTLRAVWVDRDGAPPRGAGLLAIAARYGSSSCTPSSTSVGRNG